MPRRKNTTGKNSKQKSVKSEMAKALHQLSRWVRAKYADPNTGTCACVTCGKVSPWSALGRGLKKGDIMTAGHFMPKKRCPELAFDETNVLPQCWSCNNPKIGNGEQYAMGKKIEDIHGVEAAERLLNIYQNRVGGYRTKLFDLYEAQKKFKDMANVLISEKGLTERIK